jgi:hypothetical protein
LRCLPAAVPGHGFGQGRRSADVRHRRERRRLVTGYPCGQVGLRCWLRLEVVPIRNAVEGNGAGRRPVSIWYATGDWRVEVVGRAGRPGGAGVVGCG